MYLTERTNHGNPSESSECTESGLKERTPSFDERSVGNSTQGGDVPYGHDQVVTPLVRFRLTTTRKGRVSGQRVCFDIRGYVNNNPSFH